jgi:hypothetical protein
MKKTWLSGVAAVIFLTACSPVQPPQAEGNADDSYYSFDVNQNPNSYRNLDSQRFVISDDQDKIRETVQEAASLNPQQVSIVGNSVWVHVNVPSSYTKEQTKRLKQTLTKAITDAVPRYTLHLRLDKGL